MGVLQKDKQTNPIRQHPTQINASVFLKTFLKKKIKVKDKNR